MYILHSFAEESKENNRPVEKQMTELKEETLSNFPTANFESCSSLGNKRSTETTQSNSELDTHPKLYSKYNDYHNLRVPIDLTTKDETIHIKFD